MTKMQVEIVYNTNDKRYISNIDRVENGYNQQHLVLCLEGEQDNKPFSLSIPFTAFKWFNVTTYYMPD